MRELSGGPVQMRDGARLWLRPIRPGDAGALRRMHRRLSEETRRRRFFTSCSELSQPMAERFATVDFETRAAVVVVQPGEDEVRGVARYEVVRPGEAEGAFVIEDRLQGQGIGREMLCLLAAHAATRGVGRFIAHVLPENAPMLTVLRQSGFPVTFRLVGGTYVVELDISGAAGAASLQAAGAAGG